MLRVLHTSDWHLGHRLHDVPRLEEHRAFLDWLLDTLEAERIDALIVSGDVFDNANPGAAALRLYYDFLGACARRLPKLDVVIVGGNHDSSQRLDAPRAIAHALGIHIVGGLPRTPDGGVDRASMLVPLHDADGQVAALTVAVPFLRRSDLRYLRAESHSSALRRFYADVVALAEARRASDQAIVVTGHLYASGTLLSELSERRIQQGYVEAVEADLFAPSVAYAALGHLHRAQRVADQERLSYCGSPLPLAFGERRYPHQVRLVVLEGPMLSKTVAIRVPRFVDLLPVPERHAPLDEALAALEALPPAIDGVPPLVEVRVALDAVEPQLRQLVEEALDGRHARLVRIDALVTGHERPLAEQVEARLERLHPIEVFEACWARRFDAELPDDVRALFTSLLETVQQEGTP